VSLPDEPSPRPDEPSPRPDERVRLFVALELPAPVREALIGWRGGPGRARDLRPLAAESLHATLCFLGWRPAREIEAIAGACGALAGDPAPELSLGEPRWLPPRRPRVLAVDLVDPSGALARAQATLSSALAAGGWYQPEKRPYLAHVTVARVARGGRPPRGPLPPIPSLEFRAGKVRLYRSRLLRAGAQYEPLATIELNPP
jgi:RNA 2',3'-cyclic 3'-phosphodiesterase